MLEHASVHSTVPSKLSGDAYPSQCPEHPSQRRLSRPPGGSPPVEGEAWWTRICINFPVLDLINQTLKDIRIPVPNFDTALQRASIHRNFKRRPCIVVCAEQRKRVDRRTRVPDKKEAVRFFTTYPCATFGGNSLEEVDRLTRRFVVSIYTGPEHETSRDKHVHSVPAWTADGKTAHALVLPTTCAFASDSFGEMSISRWPATTTPRLQEMESRNYRFDEDAMDVLQAHYLSARREWDEEALAVRWETMRDIKDMCFKLTREEVQRLHTLAERHERRLANLRKRTYAGLNRQRNAAREALEMQLLIINLNKSPKELQRTFASRHIIKTDMSLLLHIRMAFERLEAQHKRVGP